MTTRHEAATITVSVIEAWPDALAAQTLTLPDGARVRDALAMAGRSEFGDGRVGRWGRHVALDALLRDGDRVELYRPLVADPKSARKRRAEAQGYRWQGRTRRALRERSRS
ncbi:MAG: RnfH family protein [Burkholderiales bacterium]|nr:RnfH family protein [Pseudomonadota bacterium]MCC7068074.1 RnfH family protein [Burkholderiales bacterium]